MHYTEKAKAVNIADAVHQKQQPHQLSTKTQYNPSTKNITNAENNYIIKSNDFTTENRIFSLTYTAKYNRKITATQRKVTSVLPLSQNNNPIEFAVAIIQYFADPGSNGYLQLLE